MHNWIQRADVSGRRRAANPGAHQRRAEINPVNWERPAISTANLWYRMDLVTCISITRIRDCELYALRRDCELSVDLEVF